MIEKGRSSYSTSAGELGNETRRSGYSSAPTPTYSPRWRRISKWLVNTSAFREGCIPSAHLNNWRFPSSDGTVLRSRLLVTRGSRLRRSRRRQANPPHSRSSLRLKQETARPSQISSGRPHLSPRDQGFRTSPSSPYRVTANPVCRPAPGLSTFTRIFLPFSSLSHVRANER
jgi:hypothetical protein